MAPVSQLGVLAFASAVLAVPHAQWQPFKRHAHPGAPPAYASSQVYGASSVDPESASSWSGSAPAYPSGSSVGAASASSSWSVPAYPSASSDGAISGSAPPYPSGSASRSGWAFPTGGYGGSSASAWGTGYSSSWGAISTGYSGPVSYSTCTETDTLIYRSTTSYSTYEVTHTIYVSGAPSSVAPASYDPSWSAPAHVYSSPASPADGTCVPDVTVTATVQTTVYVTPGAYSGAASGAAPSYAASAPNYAAVGYSSVAAVSSAAAPSYGGGSWSAGAEPSSAAAPSYPAASSYSAAAPSYSAPSGGAPTGGSGGLLGKRGLAYNDASLANVLGGGAAGGWAYNWISNSGGLDSSIPYIPMLHAPTSDFTGSWESDAQAGIAAGVEYLFSFNEPDMSTQSDLTPAAAAAAWKQYMEPFAGQAKLVAPSVTNSQDANMGLDWLQQFFDACSDCTIDAVAQHWYFPTNDVQNFQDQITNAAKIGGGKGVFISEFGATGSDSDKSDFLSQVMPWLDSNDSVLGYSYFMVSDGLLMTGNSPSSYGETYTS